MCFIKFLIINCNNVSGDWMKNVVVLVGGERERELRWGDKGLCVSFGLIYLIYFLDKLIYVLY